MVYANSETSRYFEELLAEYEARMDTVLEMEMAERGEEVYYYASALVDIVQDLEGEFNSERIDSLEESLEEFEERYLEESGDVEENRLALSFDDSRDPPSAV